MAEHDSSAAEIHVYKPDQQSNTLVIEGEKNWTNSDALDSSNINESHHQKEQIIIANPNDPLSNVTHRLEEIHVTENSEISAAVAPIENRIEDITDQKTTEVKNEAVVAATNVQENVKEAAQNAQEATTELKQDAAAGVQVVEDTMNETVHDVQDKAAEVKGNTFAAAHDAQEKGKEVAGNTKDTLIAGEKVAEEKLAAAQETVQEKASELAGGAKHVAHEGLVKAQELKETVGEKLEVAGKIGEQKLEETKQSLSEKGPEVKAKGAEILDTTQQTLATGAAVATEKTKQGIELASGVASNIKAATGQFAADAQAKVVETAQCAQVKAGELLTTVGTKAAAVTDVIATKAVEAKDTTVAAAQTAASTVQEKTSALMESTKKVAAPSPPIPIVPARTDLISQEAYVTETSGQTAHGAEPAVTSSQATATTKSGKGGPINAIRNFFTRIFNPQRHEDRHKSSETATVQTTETVITTATIATSNPPK